MGVTALVTARLRVGGNDRTSEYGKGNGSEQNATELHGDGILF